MVVVLININRSHESLLTLPSKLFYDNELVACASPLQTNHFLRWKHLQNPEVPLIFHSVCGFEQREKSNPSYYNQKELDLAIDYAKKIVSERKARAEEIMVITPYKRQAQKFRVMLEQAHLKDVRVSFDKELNTFPSS